MATKAKPLAEVLAAIHYNERASADSAPAWGELTALDQSVEMSSMAEVIRYLGLFGWEVFAKGDEVFVQRSAPKPVLKPVVIIAEQSPTALSAPRMTIVEAKQRGFEGEICSQCGSMQMVRNGSCLKCMSCGTTTGCS